MPPATYHIPFVKSIPDFFSVYGLGKPLHPEIMCMRLDDQPDDRLMHMPLYRVNFFRVIHFTNTSLNFYTGEKTVALSSNCICFSYPGKLESWTRSGKLTGFVIYFTPAFAGLDVTNKNFDSEFPYFNFNAEQMLPLTKTEAADLNVWEKELLKEIVSEAPDKLEFIKKLLHVYLQKIKRVYYARVHNLPDEARTSRRLYNLFRKELDEYILQLLAQKQDDKPGVSAISKRLHVSPNYLNGKIKEITGKPASVHIQDKLLLEAKSFLLHTNLQVSEIARKLGFENITYFNRFFKKGCSESPQAFRKQFAKR
ncbi:MAG: AraC family transcriptional regulator [Chitinophagaceae bacterium]|nr:AraC family transcriptional regulator [Chitinophagaceae bacterium]